MARREELFWKCGQRRFACGMHTLVAGILNATPDSFSDGGRFFDLSAALSHARAMIHEGADMIDIGGESSRPGSEPVTLEEERRRVIPLIEAIRRESDIPLSIDTTKAPIARDAIEAGVDVVNDITGLRGDPEMLDVISGSDCGLVIMHMQGKPKTMQQNPHYDDVVGDVEAFFQERIDFCLSHGIREERIAVDPGIGFGKKLEHNLHLIAHAGRFRRLGVPVYLGISRKSFIGMLSDADVSDRLPGSLAGAAAGILSGGDIVRVHDVAETRQLASVIDAVKSIRDMEEEV
ncbi:MAG: dihydropteroate synthase [Candidatus Sumerlaeia bacterium]